MSRENMPQVAAFIDELRSVFGKTEIDTVIRRGLKADCLPHQRFFATEAGYELGRRYVPGVEISAADMVLGEPMSAADAKKAAR